MDKNQVQIIIQCALSSPCIGRIPLTKTINAALVKNGFHRVNESKIRGVLDEWELGNANMRFFAIRAIKKQVNPIFVVDEDSIPGSQLSENASIKIVPDYPGHIGFYGVIKVNQFSRKLYQQTFIDAYSSFAIVELIEIDNDEKSVNFLLGTVKFMRMKSGGKISKVYCEKRYEDRGDFRAKIDDSGFRFIFSKVGIDENLFTVFKEKIMSEFYASLTDAPLLILQGQMNKWINTYNLTPNPKRYCYGKSPLRTFNDFIW